MTSDKTTSEQVTFRETRYSVWYEPKDQPGRQNLVTNNLTAKQANDIMEELQWLGVKQVWAYEE